MLRPAFDCDQCGVTRGSAEAPASAWVLLDFAPWNHEGRAPYFHPWDDSQANDAGGHICSPRCAHITLEKYLADLREG